MAGNSTSQEARLLITGRAVGFWLRIGSVAVLVLACHQFDWHAWRAFQCTVFVAIAHAVGIPVQRISYEMFTTAGQLYRFDIACTALDAFLGSIALLWEPRKSVAGNAAFLAVYFAVLSAANMARLILGLWIFLWGVPWWLGHEAMAGVCYFLLFLWIARRRGWTRAITPRYLGPATVEAFNQ